MQYPTPRSGRAVPSPIPQSPEAASALAAPEDLSLVIEYLSILAEDLLQARRLRETPPPYQYDSSDEPTGPRNAESAKEDVESVVPTRLVFSPEQMAHRSYYGSFVFVPTSEMRDHLEHRQSNRSHVTELSSHKPSTLPSRVPPASHLNSFVETEHANVYQIQSRRILITVDGQAVGELP